MQQRLLLILSVPLAVVSWAGVVWFTAQVPPSEVAYVLFLPLLGCAVALSLAPLVWWGARRLHVPGTGTRPALALRAAGWIGLWVAACAGLQLAGAFSWGAAVALAMVLGLVESFLLQVGRPRPAHTTRRVMRSERPRKIR